MENTYGVGTVNRYALFLDDESDPLDAIKAREQAKELKKKTKEAEKENKGKPEVKPKNNVVVARKGIKETQNVKSQDNKSGEQQKANKGPARANDRNSERPPPRRREDRPPNGAVESRDGAPRPPRREFGDRRANFERRNFNENADGAERRGPRGPREPRDRDGQRGPRPYDNRGKREFDRRSGSDKTGVKPVDKREGAGPHNWGNVNDDIEEYKAPTDAEVTEEKPVETPATTAAATEEPERAPPAEEEPRELTLDEYKALRSAVRTAPQYNLRKAGEGEDLSQWKNMVQLERKKEAGSDEDSDEEYDLVDYPQRVGRQKRVLGIEFTFTDAARRGGAGGPRGRGRGRGRGGRSHDSMAEDRRNNAAAPPKVDDSKDFPSLG